MSSRSGQRAESFAINLTSTAFWEIFLRGIPAIVTWYAAHQASIQGWALPWVILLGCAVFLLLSVGIHYLVRTFRHASDKTVLDNQGAGLDLTRVKENNGVLWTTVGGCEIRVIEGRIEDYAVGAGVAIALPCNEYFDDRCAEDTKSALGAYVNKVFEGQVQEFVSLMKTECKRTLGPGVEQQKTDKELAESFGVGKCVLLTNPLGRSVPIALVASRPLAMY
jgi:hypothetical protein